ncbi:MAG: DUF4834 domain-containing protein [Flavobacteriaceae bacterium]|nr:MAG: DUF4834 domain-containing protein [Flavobacteriaceae bacterium]
MIGVLKTILYLFVFYYIFKFIGKFIMPLIFRKAVSTMEKKMREQQGQSTYSDPKMKEGETVIDKKPSPKKNSKDVGEYIDFEELDDE